MGGSWKGNLSKTKDSWAGPPKNQHNKSLMNLLLLFRLLGQNDRTWDTGRHDDERNSEGSIWTFGWNGPWTWKQLGTGFVAEGFSFEIYLYLSV